MVDFLELPDVDHEGHFQALSDLADSLDRWVEKWAEEADTAAKSKPKHEHQVDAVISVYQHAGFVEMARSHALICSITAFCESLFKNQFPLLHWSFKGTLPSDHPRVAKFVSSSASFWDPTKPTKVEKGENSSCAKSERVIGTIGSAAQREGMNLGIITRRHCFEKLLLLSASVPLQRSTQLSSETRIDLLRLSEKK